MFKLNFMETLRIVNKSLIGELEHAVLQNVNTNTTYEFSQVVNYTIADNDISNPIIQQILNNGHTVQSEIIDGNVTLHF